MVRVSNGILSDGSVIRSRKENGSCSTNGASVLPRKWKPRHVSAVRDFPQGCGPAQPVVSQQDDASALLVNNNGVNISGVNDAGTSTVQVESLCNDISKYTENGGVGVFVEPLKMEIEALVNKEGNHQATAKEEVSRPDKAVAQVEDVKALPPTQGTVDGSNVVKGTVPKIKFPRRRVSAVRDFPPYCGYDATDPTEEECIRINGKRSVGADEMDKMIVDGEESIVGVQDGEVQKHDVSGVEVEPEDKLDTEPQEGDRAGQACQELVVYTRDKVVKRPSSVDVPGEDSKGKFEEEIIQNRAQEIVPIRSVAPIQMDIKKTSGKVRKVGHDKRIEKRPLDDTNDLGFIIGERKVVLGMMASSHCPWGSVEKHVTNTDNSKRSKGKVRASGTPKKSTKKSSPTGKVAYTGTLDMVVRGDDDFVVNNEEQREDSPTSQGPHDVDVALPRYGPKSSSDVRDRVRETLRYFQALCRKLLQGEEAKTSEGDGSKSMLSGKRIDLAAVKLIKEKGREHNPGKKTFGPVPGVEVGDEFQYRVELALVGIHGVFQAGIDYIKQGKDIFAVSVVASGGYDDELDNPDVLIYSGSGGIGKDKKVEDQKLERGNLALKNNVIHKHPVRVVRGYKGKAGESSESKSKVTVTYIYDGLYTVDRYWQEPGPLGNVVFKYELKRIPGQPELALREVKKSKKFKIREGLCVDDITDGKEVFRICAVNTIDDEKPPCFSYITKMIYPDWYRPVPPKGCKCVTRCSDKRCCCAFKNGGGIPYNHNGAIVEAKTLVYECGPSCKCPPTCYNRVTQHGMKINLEIFKTESRGWGVRSLSSISSGSFICEYIGELLEDTEAEKRTNDEYLFDIGKNYNDCSLNPDTKSSSSDIVDAGGFTIDAANYGNVSRFINHSCSPNLYAQNVLYDEEDKRMPHIMLFAMENIPPLQELTYHYNYKVDTVHDSDGNIKIKSCYCGSSECTGRLY